MRVSSQPAAIVTGASSGIGAACALALADRGYAVALAARRQDRLTAVAERLRAGGARALAVPADVTDEGAMRALASRSLAAFGRLDLLVCSAGIGYQGTLEETPPAVVRQLFDVNVIGTLNAARAVAPYFEAQRAGHVVVIASITGKRGIPGYGAYCASKFGQVGLAEVLRTELRSAGVAVTTVFPVTAATEFREAMARNFGVRVAGAGPSQPADAVARAVLRALTTRAAEVYPLRRARLLVWLGAFLPRVADRLVSRFARRRRNDDVDPPSHGTGTGTS